MEFLKEWCFCICVSLIIVVVFSIFTPSGKMKGFYKILLSLFVFISFLYPIKDFNINAFELKEIDLEYDGIKASNAYEKTVNGQIEDFLKSEGVKGAVVSSEIDVDYENSEIEIKSVRIAISDDYDKKTVKNKVFEKLGINAEVVDIGD